MADLVWHYTTGAGLRGILETNLLWASDVRYLNDESELEHAVKLLDGAFDEGMAALPNGPFRDWIAGRKSQLERFETMAVFAACFCYGDDRGDLLSMWRAYASQTGYSIGFEPQSMNFLLAMIYDETEQRRQIIEVMRRFHDRYQAEFPNIPAGDTRLELLELDLLSAIATKMIRMKHPAFSDEHEVRRPIFHSLRADPADRVNFREVGNLGFRPYMTIAREQFDGGTGRFPIKRIIVGPTMHPALAERGLQMLLNKTGYTDTTIERSKIPLRAAPPFSSS